MGFMEEASYKSKSYPELIEFSFRDNWLVTFVLIKVCLAG